MPRCDFRAPRLYLDAPIEEGASNALDASQANYLGNVLRLKAGDGVLVFNGHDGEWRGTLASAGKRRLALAIGTRTRPQTAALDLHYLFAPLKHARLDYMVQKAVEMGASRLQPVLTRHAQIARINLERMRANAIEAAEQCGIMTLPEIRAPLTLERLIAEFDPHRLLVFCDEEAEVNDPVAALSQARDARVGGPWRSPSSSVPRGASQRTNAPRSWNCRMRCGLRSGRAFCAPIPPRSRRSRWWGRCSGIGARCPKTGPRPALSAPAVWDRIHPPSMLKRRRHRLNRLRPRHDERQNNPDDHHA